MNHNSFNTCCPNQSCHRVMLQARFRHNYRQPGSCRHSTTSESTQLFLASAEEFVWRRTTYFSTCYFAIHDTNQLVQRRLNMCVVSPGRPCRPLPWHFDEIWRETECCRGNIYVLTHLNTPSSSLSPLLSYSQSVFTICCPPPCYRLQRRRRDL